MKKINCPNLAKNLIILLILSLVFAVLFSGSIYALSSDNINLQGKIVRNDIGHEGMNVIPGSPACVVNGPSNDTCDFRVSYYTALTSGTLLLTEDFTNVEIGQFDGVFELSLGSGTVTTTLQCRDGTCNSPSEVISEYGDLYVELQFAPDGSTLTETFTRMPLEASPYAIFSKFAEGAHDAFKLSTSVSNESLENPSAGMIYFDTGSSQLKVYNGAEWQALSAGTSSSLWTDAGTYSYLTSTTDDLVLGGSTFNTGRFVFDMDGGSGSYFDIFNNDHSNKLFTILNSGNVGIGTATPGAKLEVGGDASTITNSTGNLTISTGGGNGNILLMPNGTGKVGIGTSSPTVALDVIGDIKASGVIRNVTVSGTTSTAAATAAKVVSIPNYTLTTGDLLSITFTNGNSVSNPTLNVNSTGAKNIRVGNTNATRTTMTISAGATLILYYDGTYFQMMGSQRTSDSNTYDRTYWGNAITAGTTIYSYKLLMQSTDGKWYPLTLENGTGTTKTVSTQPFIMNSPILYYATTTTVSPNATFSNVYSEIPTTYLNYTANQGTWTSQLPIYLKGRINSSGNFVLDNTSYTSFLTQSLPTSEDGFVYILLGQMYSTTGIRLFQYHPIYEYKNGRVQPYNPSHTHNWGSILNADGVYMDYRPSNIACSSDQILKYDSINSRWICADDNAGTGDNWGSQVVITNSTLTGNGTSGSPLGIALSNANTWTGMQTFRGLTVDSATATDDRIITSITTGGSARYDGTLTNADLTAARTWTLPNATGTIALGTGTTSQLAYWTSTNTLESLDYSGWDTNASDDVTTFLGLTDTPGSYSGSGNYLVRVNSAETALEFVEASAFTDTDNYVDSVDFNAGNGVLTLGRTGALSDLTTSLDGRYLPTGTDNWVNTTGDTMTGTLTFSGVSSDITTVNNEHLSLMPNGTGNVGIGTTNPTEKLEVNGTIRVDDPATGIIADLSLTRPYYGRLNYAVTPNNGKSEVRFVSKGATSGTGQTYFVVASTEIGDTGNNLLMGVASGRTFITNALNYSTAGTLHIGGVSWAGDGVVQVSGVPTDATGKMTVMGNVGIGTTSPAQKLDVLGGIKLGTTSNVNNVLDTQAQSGAPSGSLYWGNSPLLTSANLGTFGVASISNSDGTLTISPTVGNVIASLNLSHANTWTGAQTFNANTYFPGSGIWNTSGNVGIGTTNTNGYKLNVAGDMYAYNFNQKSFSLAVPANIGDAIEFASVTNTNFSSNVEIWLTIHSSGYAQSKRYIVPVQYNGTGGVWHKALPISTTGVYSGNDAEIDVKISAQVATFRIRRTAGATAGTASITLAIGGDTIGTTISPSSTTYTAQVVTVNYAPTSLTMRTGKTGINNDIPNAYLDIMGTTEQLRVGYDSSNYFSTTVSNTGLVTFNIVGSSNTLSLASGDSFNLVSGNVQIGSTTILTSGRLVQAANGSVSSPAFSFSSDTNTGMYGTGSDILRLVTAGADRVTINASGNVGIGTTSPTAYLHLKAGTSSANTAPLKFTTGANLATPESGAMEWDGSRLYITNTTPTRNTIAYLTDIAADTDNYVDSVSFNTGDGILTLGRTGALPDLTTDLDGRYALSSAGMPSGTEGQMLYNNAGTWTAFSGMYWDDINSRLGIGTTSPTEKLEVTGNLKLSAGANRIISVENVASGNAYNITIQGGSTSDPVTSTGGDVTLKGGNTNSFGSGGNIYLTPGYSADIGYGTTYVDGKYIHFRTGSTTLLYDVVINSTGQLGIGIPSPTAYLNLKAGTASTYSAPLKFTAGVNLTTAESGAMEWDGSRLYMTNTTLTRNTLAYTSDIYWTRNGSTLYPTTSGDSVLPNGTANLGSDTSRWADIFLSSSTLHIGSSITDEGIISYDTTNNIFKFDTDSTTNGDISFFTDDLYLDKSSGYVGVGDISPTSLLTVGNGDLFQVNSSGDLIKIKNVTYSWPSSNSSGVLTNNGSGTLTWAAAAGATLWNEIVNPNANKTFTMGSYTTDFQYNTFTSGSAYKLSSSSTGFTGSLLDLSLTGSNAANIGNLLTLYNTGTDNANTSLLINHYATGTNNLAFRVNDESGDTTPFVIDGQGRVGIGTDTPNHDLDVNGTIQAYNFINSAGMPVNDILLEQEVRNLSITAMTGSLGLDMTSSFVVKKAETTFNAWFTSVISVNALENGNILIAYNDAYNGSPNFVIYDSSGNLVKSETNFNSGNINYISATTLTNGNVLIAYKDNVGNYGNFVIYDSSGNLVKSETTFNAGTTYHLSATTLTNGNVLIAYKDNVGNYGNFVIYDSSGNLVKSETNFNSGNINYISATTLTNGNVLIAYYDDDSEYGNFVIYDSSGNLVVSETTFNAGTAYELSATTLTNGNVLIAYRDGSSSDYGNFVIYDSLGNQVVSETTFNAGTTYEPSATTLTNGNVLISYNDGYSNGNFVIYDSLGNLVVSETTFNAGTTYEPSATTLTNGNVLIAYRDGSSSNYGKFVIYGSSGAYFANKVGIGTSTPTQALDVLGSGRFSAVGSGTYASALNITSDGTLTTSTSDARLKTNIENIDSALEKVLQLRGVYFNWKEDENGQRMTGMIAQEVMEVMPELVFMNKVDGYYGINYGEATGLLIEAIKEQQLQIQTAYNRIEQLENINENKIRSITTPGWYRISKLDTNDDHSNIKINNTSVGSSQNIVLSIDSTLNNQNINVVSNLTTGEYDITKARINNKNGVKYLEIYIPEVNGNKISVKITESSNWVVTDIVQITEEDNNAQEYALSGILFGISDRLEVEENNIKITGNLLSSSLNSSIGDSANRWNDIYARGIIRLGSGADGEGAIRFNVQTKTLEFSNNGVEWLSVGDLSSQMTISPEYAGAILFADGSDNSGIMTSDAVEEGGSFKNYYEWVSNKDTPQDYDILVRITLPADFLSWKEDAIYIDIMTENSVSTDNNSVGLSLIGNSGTDVQITGGISKIAGTWERMSIKGADITQCNSAGETCTLRISLTSSMEYFTRVGDITLNYNRSL